VTVRVYVPATLGFLAEFVRLGEIPEQVERFAAMGADEEAEYLALMSAADSSAALLDGPGRRVVVVADLDDPDGAVPMSRVVAVHADPAERPFDADPDEDLAWYAAQEIETLLAD
jgi:hypothetical protein